MTPTVFILVDFNLAASPGAVWCEVPPGFTVDDAANYIEGFDNIGGVEIVTALLVSPGEAPRDVTADVFAAIAALSIAAE